MNNLEYKEREIEEKLKKENIQTSEIFGNFLYQYQIEVEMTMRNIVEDDKKTFYKGLIHGIKTIRESFYEFSK